MLQMSSSTTTAASQAQNRIRVAAFTGGQYISSRRFRLEQYIPVLRQGGVDVTEYIARFGSWPPRGNALRPFWLVGTVLQRIQGVMNSHACDLTLLQREMVSTLLTLERFVKEPRVLDIDDAVWLNKGAARNFRSLARMCNGVICGNSFIAEYMQALNNNLLVLPTAVDTHRFHPGDNASELAGKQVIGWSGLNAGFKYVTAIEPALAEVLRKRKNAVLRIVSDVQPRFNLIAADRVEFVRWSPDNEVATIRSMNVGLMPIDDSVWSKGKCSYKMLLYMACGLPVVVSPYGMNGEVLLKGRIGLGACSLEEWTDSILWILDNPQDGRIMGAAGRQVVMEHYSLERLAPQLISFLRSFVQ